MTPARVIDAVRPVLLGDTGVLLFVGGALAAMAVSAHTWSTRPRLRFLPIVYGLVFGVVIAAPDGGKHPMKVLELVATFTGCGAGFWFSLWIESGPDRR